MAGNEDVKKNKKAPPVNAPGANVADDVNDPELAALWNDENLDEIKLSRYFFKPDKVPVGTLMYGYLTGCESMTSKFGDMNVLVFKLIKPALCWEAVAAGDGPETGELRKMPAGTTVLFVMNEKLKDLQPYAYVQSQCIDILIKVTGKIATAKHEMHTFEFKVGKSPVDRMVAIGMGLPEGMKKLIETAGREAKQLAESGA